MRTALTLLALLSLSGCFIVQDAYDQEAIDQCRELPNTADRIDCEYQAEEAARDRRNERRNKE